MDNDLTDLKVSIAHLVEATKVNTQNIGTLTEDVKELAKDLKETLCAKHECDSLKQDMAYMKEKQAKLDGRLSVIEGVPTALMKRFVLVLVGASALYIASQIGMAK